MKELIYIVEKGGLSNSQNNIAIEGDEQIKPGNFQYLKIEEVRSSHLADTDFLILEDEAKNQIQLIKAVSKFKEIKKVITCDNLDVFSIIIEKMEASPKIITLDYKIGAVNTTEKLHAIYNKLKIKFEVAAIVGYTNYALNKKDGDFSESSADELTKLLRENGDSVISKAAMNEQALSSILFDRMNVSKLKEVVTKSETVINELKSEQEVNQIILDKLLANYKENELFNKLVPPLIGNSKAIKKVKYFIERFAKNDLPIFITGESGTGKELVARAIHLLGRKGTPFVDVSPAIPEELIESELFGHEKNSFNQANERIGKFEAANGGVLFIDEIADISPNIQKKILRAIQERYIVRVGSNIRIPVNVKLVTATNKDLGQLIKQNLFRGDLYYRINSTFPKLPPLRERTEDIPALVNYFLKINLSDARFSPETFRYLQTLPWRGNIRELKQVVEHTITLFAEPREQLIDISKVQLIIEMLNKNADQDIGAIEFKPNNLNKDIVIKSEDNCSSAETFLNNIEEIINNNFIENIKVSQEEIVSYFITKTGQTGLSRGEFSKEYLNRTKHVYKNCFLVMTLNGRKLVKNAPL